MNDFQSPPGFLRWRDHAKMARTIIRAWELGRNNPGMADDPTMPSLWMVAYAERCKAPPRFVSQGMVEAFLHTPTPALPSDLPTVLPSFRLFLPLGMLKTEEGSSISVIIVNDVRVGDSQGLQCLGISQIGELYNALVRFHGEPALPDDDLSEQTISTLEQIERIAANAVLVHCYQPELIQQVPLAATGQGSRGAGFANPNPAGRASPAPLWIGHGFQFGGNARRSLGEFSYRLRPHWRRGHWHTVAHGQGKGERRLRWFQPVYVGAATP